MLGGVAFLLKCIGVDSFLRIKVIYPLVFVVGILLCMIWSGLALGVRRLHDLGRSGWWIFSCFVTEVFVLLFFRVVGDTWGWSAYGHIAEKFSFGVGVLFSIYLLFFKGTVGPNRYGDDPLEKHSKTKIDSNI